MIYLLNHWQVNLLENSLTNTLTSETVKIEPKSMAVLALLIENQKEVVSREDFVSEIWNGRVTVDESLTRCISELRKVLEDDTKQPAYINTIHKKGYKLLVEAHKKGAPTGDKSDATEYKNRNTFIVAGVFTLLIGVFALSWLFNDSPAHDLNDSKTLPIYGEISEVRQQLLQPLSFPTLFIWNNANSNSKYTIKANNFAHSETGEERLLLQLIDGYENVLWETSHTVDNPEKQSLAVESLVEVLRLLEVHNQAPELALLPTEQRSLYRRATYLIDKRGHENLEKAIELLDIILDQRPDFVMAIIQKAVAARMLSFYLPTRELREQQFIQFTLLLKQARTLAPEHPVVKSLTTKIDLKLKNWRDYESLLVNAVEYSPACVICVRSLAEHYLNLGFYKKAEGLVSHHIDYFPLSIMMHSFLGQIYNMQGSSDEARQQVKIIKALHSSGGSDTLAMEINIAMNEGDVQKIQELVSAMVNKHPAYGDNKAAVDAQINADLEALIEIAEKMPLMDFNVAVSAGKIADVVTRINRNIYAGNLRDLRLLHGWLTPETHFSDLYARGLLQLKNRPEIQQLLDDIGLISYWRESNRWPDYCYYGQYSRHRPEYCPP